MPPGNQSNIDDVSNPEMAVRCSCDICMETYDSKVHIPRVVKCGHSACQKCIREMIDANSNYKCPFCNSLSKVVKVEELPVNRSLIDIVDYVRTEGQKRNEEVVRPAYFCAHRACTAGSKDVNEIAMCMTQSCAQFRKCICFSCVIEHHKKHEIVRLASIVNEVRNRSRAQLEAMKDETTKSMREVYTLIERANGMKEEMWQKIKNNASLDELINRSDQLCSQQEAKELQQLGQDLIDPYKDAFSSWKEALDRITAEMEEIFVEGVIKERTDVPKIAREAANNTGHDSPNLTRKSTKSSTQIGSKIYPHLV